MTEQVLHPPWQTIERQRIAMQFGMWTFLASEVLFFGAIFFFYTVARIYGGAGFIAGAHETELLYGTINTALLVTSSLTMTIGERAVGAGFATLARRMFAVTIALGIAFLAVKGWEYWSDITKHLVPGPGFKLDRVRGASQFWSFYWVVTVIHAGHLTIGLGAIARLLLIPRDLLARRATTAEGTSLYWHLVDVVWLFLYAMIYLAGRP
jgi:cytochrome c oxidase subunit III